MDPTKEYTKPKMKLGNKAALVILIVSFLAVVALFVASPSTTDESKNLVYHDPMELPTVWQWCYWATLCAHFLVYVFCSIKWTYCSLIDYGLRATRFNEVWLLAIRWMHFLFATALICLILIGNNTISPTLLFPMAVLLWLSFYHALSRTTFRPVPCYLLALAAVIMFIAFSGLPYNSDVNMWGLGYFVANVFKFLDIIFKTDPSTLKSLFASSAMIAILASTVLAAGKKMLNKYLSQAEDTAEKNKRRQLLTHWWYNPKAVLIENASICVAVGFVSVCAILLITSAYKEEIENKTIGYSLLFFSAVASILSTVGIIGLFTTRDNDLIKSEYYFLHYTALQIGQFRLGEDDSLYSSVQADLDAGCLHHQKVPYAPLLVAFDKLKIYLNHRKLVAHLTRGMFGCVSRAKAERRINDFSQVAIDLLINNSTIRSENEVEHHVNYIFDCIGSVVRCKQTHGVLVSGLFNAYCDVRNPLKTVETEIIAASKNNEKEEKREKTKKRDFTESDLLFSSMLFSLMNSSYARKCLPIQNINTCIQTMRKAMLASDIKFYLSHQDLSANDLLELTLFDAFIEIARMFDRGGCITSSHCSKTCTECRLGKQKSLSDLEVAHHKRLAVLLFPLLVLQSLSLRCPTLIGTERDHKLEKITSLITKYYLDIAVMDADACPSKEPVAQALPNYNDSQIKYNEKIHIIAKNAFALFEKFAETFEKLPLSFRNAIIYSLDEISRSTRGVIAPTYSAVTVQISANIESAVNDLLAAGLIPVTIIKREDQEYLVSQFLSLRNTLQRLSQLAQSSSAQSGSTQNGNSQSDINNMVAELNASVNSIEHVMVSAEYPTLTRLTNNLIYPVFIVSGYSVNAAR